MAGRLRQAVTVRQAIGDLPPITALRDGTLRDRAQKVRHSLRLPPGKTLSLRACPARLARLGIICRGTTRPRDPQSSARLADLRAHASRRRVSRSEHPRESPISD